MARRSLLWMVYSAMAAKAAQRPKLGDPDWMRRFREFVKTFNEFIISLNDDKLDVGQWERMRSAWHRVEGD